MAAGRQPNLADLTRFRRPALGPAWPFKDQEVRVVRALKSYVQAQMTFRRKDWDRDGRLEFARDYRQLYLQLGHDGKRLGLLDRSLLDADGPHGKCWHGYLFKDAKTLGGRPIDSTTTFALCATPAVYGKTGQLTFIVSRTGRVMATELGKSEFLSDFPADPYGAGWFEVVIHSGQVSLSPGRSVSDPEELGVNHRLRVQGTPTFDKR